MARERARGRPNVFATWLLHRLYALRGRRDGRRAMPLVSLAGGQPSPTLHRLSDEMIREVALLRADEVEQTVAPRVSLAQLTGPTGEMERERDRLDYLLARLEEVKASGPPTDRRLGEEELPDELVLLRREREHERRLRTARKRVEEQKTHISALARKEHGLRAGLAESRRTTEAQVRLVGAARKAEASTYLNGALRTHPDRRLLSALVPELTPRLPARPTAPTKESS